MDHDEGIEGAETKAQCEDDFFHNRQVAVLGETGHLGATAASP